MFCNSASADFIDNHVHILTARAVSAVTIAVTKAAATLDAALRFAVTIKASDAIMVSLIQLDDVAEEASTNVQQLTSYAALLKWPNVLPMVDNDLFVLSGPFALEDPFLFNMAVCISWSLTLAAPHDVDVTSSLCRLVTSVIEGSLCELSGPGLTVFDPSDTADARKRNVICVVPRDAHGVVANWVSTDDIRLSLLPENMSAGLSLSFDVTADGDCWRVAYSVYGNCIGINIRLTITIAGVSVRECHVKVGFTDMLMELVVGVAGTCCLVESEYVVCVACACMWLCVF